MAGWKLNLWIGSTKKPNKKCEGSSYGWGWEIKIYWLVVSTILENMKVNGKDDIPYIVEKKITTNQTYMNGVGKLVLQIYLELPKTIEPPYSTSANESYSQHDILIVNTKSSFNSGDPFKLVSFG